jgi:hypothetical protein
MECAGFDYEYNQQTVQDQETGTAGPCLSSLQIPARASLVFRGLSDKSRSLEVMNRYETRLDRQFKTTLDRLERIRERRAKSKNNDSASTDRI